jgi:hypothetical protein
MFHLLILLFHLFHYGRTQVFQVGAVGTIPLIVRSPYLNCWSSNSEDLTGADSTVAAVCNPANWNFVEPVCYFLPWNNTKIDWTLGP